MITRQGDVDTTAFILAQPHRVAATLDRSSIHLWWLPYRRSRGRAPLKALLAAYLDTTPNALRVIDGEYGRPCLAPPHALDFNWSHSADGAMVAIAHDLHQLGVDVERRRPRARTLALARRFFADEEYVALQSLPPAQRNEAFIRLWTAKEAVLKAHGRGIAYGLHRVAFTLDKTGPRPQRFQGEVGEPDQWQCCGIQPHTGFYATVAWRGSPRYLRCFRCAAETQEADR